MRSRIKRRKSWYLIWTVIFLLFFASIISIILTLPAFKIANVQVIGCRLLPPELIPRIANIPLGENIFLTHFDKAAERVLAIPIVKKAEILRVLPDTVLIRIKERKEAAVTVLDGQSVLLDEEGVIINPQSLEAVPIEFSDISNLPVLIGVKKEWFEGGRLRGEIGESATRLLSEFKNYISPRSLKIDLSSGGGIDLLMDDTLKVKIGDKEKIDLKIKNFEIIFEKIKNRKNEIDYIDVRSPKFPAIRYK